MSSAKAAPAPSPNPPGPATPTPVTLSSIDDDAQVGTQVGAPVSITLPAPSASGVWTQSPLTLTLIRGSKSLWGTAQSLSAQGGKALILKYGP